MQFDLRSWETSGDLRGTSGGFQLSVTAPCVEGPWRFDTVCQRRPTAAGAGAPRKVDNADAAKARSLRDKGISATEIAKMLSVSRATVYRYLSDFAA